MIRAIFIAAVLLLALDGARASAEHRRAHPFRRIDELTKVKGIGRKTFGRLRPYITTVGPTTLSEKVAARR